jgi:diguanylate cyclase (GGDEF)-like protein
VIPSSGGPASARMRPNDAYVELIADSLEGLESSARAQFLQRFFLSLAHVEIAENQAIALWEEILARRTQLADRSGSPISFQTALVDVLSSNGMFRVPVVIEYDELKNLHRSAITDPLTGLYNRRLFTETFQKELNRARRYAHPLSLVTLDLHSFKEVNDKHGHPRGDEVLRAAAATLKKTLRTSDSAFRIGGDEFALLLPQTDSSQASALSRRIGLVFDESLRPLELLIGVSIDHGVSTFPQDGDQADRLIQIADERLYRIKYANHGKNDAGTVNEPVFAATREVEPAAPVETSAPTPPQAQQPHPEPIEIIVPTDLPEPEPVSTAELAVSLSSETTAAEPQSALEPPPASTISPLHTQPSFSVVPEEPRFYTTPRKAERVSMSGTNAYAVLGDQSTHRARVVDLGFGGVALDFSNMEGVSETLLAVLHVPILPPVRVNLKRVWTKQLNDDTVRVGCCFIS